MVIECLVPKCWDSRSLNAPWGGHSRIIFRHGSINCANVQETIISYCLSACLLDNGASVQDSDKEKTRQLSGLYTCIWSAINSNYARDFLVWRSFASLCVRECWMPRLGHVDRVHWWRRGAVLLRRTDILYCACVLLLCLCMCLGNGAISYCIRNTRAHRPVKVRHVCRNGVWAFPGLCYAWGYVYMTEVFFELFMAGCRVRVHVAISDGRVGRALACFKVTRSTPNMGKYCLSQWFIKVHAGWRVIFDPRAIILSITWTITMISGGWKTECALAGKCSCFCSMCDEMPVVSLYSGPQLCVLIQTLAPHKSDIEY